MKYVVCYSGGHSSALAAIETVRRYGKENVILLNHDISSEVERADVKEYKAKIATYLRLPVEYANCYNSDGSLKTPLQVARDKGLFQIKAGIKLCTYELKTKPFHDWLKTHCSYDKDNYTIVYGFSADEAARIQRRRKIMCEMGYQTLYPLCEGERTIWDTAEIGIPKPASYEQYKHANCTGCLKAGRMHWYVVYCTQYEIFQEARDLEIELKSSIINGIFLKDMEPVFEEMKRRKIPAADNTCSARFWSMTHEILSGQMSLFELVEN